MSINKFLFKREGMIDITYVLEMLIIEKTMQKSKQGPEASLEWLPSFKPSINLMLFVKVFFYTTDFLPTMYVL